MDKQLLAVLASLRKNESINICISDERNIIVSCHLRKDGKEYQTARELNLHEMAVANINLVAVAAAQCIHENINKTLPKKEEVLKVL